MTARSRQTTSHRPQRPRPPTPPRPPTRRHQRHRGRTSRRRSAIALASWCSSAQRWPRPPGKRWKRSAVRRWPRLGCWCPCGTPSAGRPRRPARRWPPVTRWPTGWLARCRWSAPSLRAGRTCWPTPRPRSTTSRYSTATDASRWSPAYAPNLTATTRKPRSHLPPGTWPKLRPRKLTHHRPRPRRTPRRRPRPERRRPFEVFSSVFPPICNPFSTACRLAHHPLSTNRLQSVCATKHSGLREVSLAWQYNPASYMVVQCDKSEKKK